MSSEFAQPMMGNDYIEKPSEAEPADSRKAIHAKHKAERKRCRQGVRALLEKVKELKLVPEDDSEEEKEEMERMVEKLRKALDEVL
jgi:ribosome recycling factor